MGTETVLVMDKKGKGGNRMMPVLDIRPQSLSFCPYGRSLWLYNPTSSSSGKDIIATLSILPPSDKSGVGSAAAPPPALHLEGPFFEYSKDRAILKVESGSRVEVRASASATANLSGGSSGNRYCSTAMIGAVVINYEGHETVVPVIFESEGALEDKDDHIHALTEELVRLKQGEKELMLKSEVHGNNNVIHVREGSVNCPNLPEDWQKSSFQLSSNVGFTTATVEEKRTSNDILDTIPESYLAAQAWWLHLAFSNLNPIEVTDVSREKPVPHEQQKRSGGGVGGEELGSNHHLLYQQIEQLALDLSLSRQRNLEADIKARTTAWEQEERIAAANIRIMALEAELRARNSQCDEKSAELEEEPSTAILGYDNSDDKKEGVTAMRKALEIERKKRIDAEMREKTQTQLAEFERARRLIAMKSAERLSNELDRLKIASTVNIMEGPINVAPRMILESFVGVTRKQADRIAELENKMDQNIVTHDNNNNAAEGGGIDGVRDCNIINGGDMKVGNTALVASLETERLSRRLNEAEGELRSARDKSVALERKLSSLLHFRSDRSAKYVSGAGDTTNLQADKDNDEEEKSISYLIEVDTLKSELKATLAHNIELKDALIRSESSVIPPLGDLYVEVGLKHGGDNHTIPFLESNNFLGSCNSDFLPSSPSIVHESDMTVRLESELQEARSNLKVLEMTVEVLQKSVISEEQEEVMEGVQSGEDGSPRATTFSKLLFTSTPTTKQRLVQYCVTLASEVNSLRTTAAVEDRRVTSLLRAVSSAEACRLASEGRLSAMEKRALVAERLAAERKAQVEALIVEGRERLREAHTECQVLRHAIEGLRAQADEEKTSIRVAQATSDAMEGKLLQFLDQKQQSEREAEVTFQNRLEDATKHVAATYYTASHSISLALSSLESAWTNVAQEAVQCKEEGEGHKGLGTMMKNSIFCSTSEKEDLRLEKGCYIPEQQNSNFNNGLPDRGSHVNGGQLMKYTRLLAELLDAENLKALRLKAIADAELRWSEGEVEVLEQSLKEHHVEQCRLQARVKASEQALLSSYLSSTRGRRQIVAATNSVQEQEDLGVRIDALLHHRVIAASERAIEAASKLALMKQRCISLKEEIDRLHRVLEEMRLNMESSESEFSARVAEAVSNALKESETSFRRSIEDKVECWFETELAHLDGLDGLPVGEYLAQVLAGCKAREAEALIQVASYQMRFLPLLKENEKLRAFVKSFAIQMKNNKPQIPPHPAGAAVTEERQGSSCIYSEIMMKAQSQQAILRAQLFEARDKASRFDAEASSLKRLVKKIREDEYNVRRDVGERILRVEAGMRRIRGGKVVNGVVVDLPLIPERSHLKNKNELGGKKRNGDNKVIEQQDENLGEGLLCPEGSLEEEVRRAHEHSNVDEEMLAASSSSAQRLHLNDEPSDHVATEEVDSKARVEYLESLISESSTLVLSLLKDAENATVESSGSCQASKSLTTAQSVAATLEKMIQERESKEVAHLKHALARRERRIKELKGKLKQHHIQFSKKAALIQSSKGMNHFYPGSVIGATNTTVKQSEGIQRSSEPTVFELGLTDKVTASDLRQTSTECGGDTTLLLPINNTYLIDDETRGGLMCHCCEELTNLLKDAENRCLTLQHRVDEYCIVQPSAQPPTPTQVALEKETVCYPLPHEGGGERKLQSGEGKRIHCVNADSTRHLSDGSISASNTMIGKDAKTDGCENTYLMGELLAQQRAHAVALEAMQTTQTELSREASILREKNAEVEERMKAQITATDEARNALKARSAMCAELENEIIQANQKVTSQFMADNIALEEMSQAHKGVVRALKQSLIAVKTKAMINTSMLAKRVQFVPDIEEKQNHPDGGLCHRSSLERRSEVVAILRGILVQSNTMVAELQTQLRIEKEEMKLCTAQLELALSRLSILMSTCECKSEEDLLPFKELEKEYIILDEASCNVQNGCKLNSILRGAKLEILEAQCEEQRVLLNSMEEDLMSARQQLELQEKLKDENVNSNDNNKEHNKIILPSSASAITPSCNVFEDEMENQRSTTTTDNTRAELSKLKELIVRHLQATTTCPSSEDAAFSKEKELENLKTSLATRKAEANRRGKALAALRDVRAVNEAECVDLKEKLKICEEKLAKCLRGLGTKSTLVAQLKKQREELQTEVNTLRQSTPWSEEERSAITRSTKERDRLRSQLTMLRTKVKSLTKTVDTSRVTEVSVKKAVERAGQSEALSKELKQEIIRRRQDAMIWKQRAEEWKTNAEKLRKEMDVLKKNEPDTTPSPTTATAAAVVHPSSHALLINSLRSSLVDGVRSYARAGRRRRSGNSRSSEIHSSLAAMDTSSTGRQQHGLDSNIVSSMLGVTLDEAEEMMHCTVDEDDLNEFDWVSRAQCALLQWDGNMFWEVVREISSIRQPDSGSSGVLDISEEGKRFSTKLNGENAGAASSLVDNEVRMVTEWGECLQCAKEILSTT